MKNVLKKIYKLYFEDEYYSKQILNDKEYKDISEKLIRQQKELLLLYEIKSSNIKNIDKIFDKLFNTYMEMSNIYRYYDFINGLALGIALVTSSQLVHNQELIDKCINMINQLNDD